MNKRKILGIGVILCLLMLVIPIGVSKPISNNENFNEDTSPNSALLFLCKVYIDVGEAGSYTIIGNCVVWIFSNEGYVHIQSIFSNRTFITSAPSSGILLGIFRGGEFGHNTISLTVLVSYSQESPNIIN